MSNDLSGAVRDALDQRAQALDVRTPPWQELEAGFGQVRRSRRRRRAARAGGVVVALALAAGGVQGGVLPYPTWAPAVTIAASPSALNTGVVRGSLASDRAFLASLRQAVADGTRSVESEGTWRIPSPDDVDVLYASDAGSWRVALVEARLRTGLLEGRQQMWFAGPRGAAADRLENRSGNQPHDSALSWFDAPDGAGAGLLVVVAARPQAYVISTSPPVYAADGTVSRPVTRVEPDADGVVAKEVTAGPESEVVVSPAATPHEWQQVRGSTGDPVGAPKLPDRFVDGSPVPPGSRDLLEEARWGLVGPAGLTMRQATPLWAGPLGPWSVAAVGVTAPSGARLLMVKLSAPDQPNTRVGTDVSTALPAGPLTEAALAWQMDDPADRGDTRPVRHVGVLGPVGATSAQLVDGVTDHPAVALTDRAGLLPPPGAGAKRVQVHFRDATGRLLDMVDVLDMHAHLPSGLPR
jgi:hypothetical protein